MMRTILRAGILAGAAGAAVYAARRYWGSDFDKTMDKAKSAARDVSNDLKEKEEIVNASLRNHI